MTGQNNALGKQGEAIACGFLGCKGYSILTTNWRMGRSGELDAVAFHPETGVLAFVEVKTRRGRQNIHTAYEAITPEKCDRLRRLAEAWLLENDRLHHQAVLRFDLLIVHFMQQDAPPQVHHFEGIF